MHERPLSQSTFPTAHCATCSATVLTHLGLDSAGHLSRLCVKCDGPVLDDVTWLGAGQLEAHGYTIGNARAARASGGCGGNCGCSIRTN